jgi:hypothetical protein
MPLNREKGEFIVALGPHDAVPAPEVWKEYLHLLRVRYEIKRPGKWKKKTDVGFRSILEDIAEKVSEELLKAGALAPIQFDDTNFLVQEYHRHRKVVVICQYKVKGKELFVITDYDLTPDNVAWLVQTGRWKARRGPAPIELPHPPLAQEAADASPRTHH